jgi:hypothetical protein
LQTVKVQPLPSEAQGPSVRQTVIALPPRAVRSRAGSSAPRVSRVSEIFLLFFFMKSLLSGTSLTGVIVLADLPSASSSNYYLSLLHLSLNV